MDVLYPRVAGLDVHKKIIVVCVMIQEGSKIKKEIRSFTAVSNELESMKEWLKSQAITHIAMESTGVYWKPVLNALGDEFEIVLGNAQHIKNVPGRKTDVKDCEWIANLMRCGLIRSSFIPSEPLRDLRDLTRYRVKLVQTINAEKNRIQKVLEDTNVKLASFVTDLFGKTGQRLLQALLDGRELSEEQVDEMVAWNVKASVAQIMAALKGHVREHHRFMIRTHLDMIAHISESLGQVEERIRQCLNPYEQQWKLLQTIPGVDEVTSAAILAEVGVDMKPFTSPSHLASWAGVCPGNNESAGKKKSARINPGNRTLKRVLVQAAHAASRTKGSYLRARYKRLALRRGKKRAIVGVAHKILKGVYYILKHKVSYKDAGENFFDQLHRQQVIRYHASRLRQLGIQLPSLAQLQAHEVTVSIN